MGGSGLDMWTEPVGPLGVTTGAKVWGLFPTLGGRRMEEGWVKQGARGARHTSLLSHKGMFRSFHDINNKFFKKG